MEDQEFAGCISCLSSNDLCDLFAVYSVNEDTYAKMFETCFDIKIENGMKHICSMCIEKLESSSAFKQQTLKNIAFIKSLKDEEYLDETILEEELGEEDIAKSLLITNVNNQIQKQNHSSDIEDEYAVQSLDETRCIYCPLQLSSVEEAHEHIRAVHELEPRTGLPLKKCSLCGISMKDPADHLNRCHTMNSDAEGRQYPCHFCENVYSTKKACFTHLRMKHGLKLGNAQTVKYVQRERKKCHMCSRDFSQKQILNKHLLKAHGLEVEKRKAFSCPLCDERVSYGSHFSSHLLHTHNVCEQVEQLEFYTMDDFMLFKSAIQEETKYRFRKTTASKQTIEGVRSHYMCSQSGVYVYQGKGKRPAPERQIYKTGKACPAHMIVTETLDRVLVTFYKTHVGHGPCPYFEPREPKKLKTETLVSHCESNEDPNDNGGHSWICDTCGIEFYDGGEFNMHVAGHGLSISCQFCGEDFQDMETWTHHIQSQHSIGGCYN
ncbi:zinc finger and SCAN domain-containing protein 10-like [Amyelois transitella]|uniref:zinc finger and SCAN domain-containing protein 10-like n=1 Tax=Amyelois transitella TaxID=680683 RepID=UPI0029905988|nr:zinc finger and SCAN domain-containing protein 10-like [Amyelois transitella]